MSLNTIYSVMFFLIMAINMSCTKKNDNIRVSFLLEDSISSYQVANVNSASSYTFLEHLYSPLLEYDSEGLIRSQFISDFNWQDNNIIFSIKKNLKFSDGSPINADDIVKSFQISAKHGVLMHSDLNPFLKSGYKSILSEGNKIIFELVEKNDLFLSTLTTIDLAIVPGVALNNKGMINNYGITSGPFYVEKYSKGLAELKKNVNYKSDINYPDSITLINSPSAEATIRLIKENKIDFTTTDDFLGEDKKDSLSEEFELFEKYKTLPVKLRFISFTDAGIKKFSKEERNFLFFEVKKAFGVENAFEENQFFPDMAYGSLGKNEISEVYKLKKKKEVIPTAKVKIAIHPSILPHFKKEFDRISEYVEISLFDKIYDFNNNDFDAFFMSVDTGYYENISMVSYVLNAGFFGKSNEKTSSFNKFVKADSAKEREDIIKNAHEKALVQTSFIPLFRLPYSLIGKRGYTSPLSKTFSNTRFWLVEKI